MRFKKFSKTFIKKEDAMGFFFFVAPKTISSFQSNLNPQNIDLIADSSVSYTEISSASGASFENIRNQSGLSFETQASAIIEDSGSKMEKADSKTIPGFFHRILINC